MSLVRSRLRARRAAGALAPLFLLLGVVRSHASGLVPADASGAPRPTALGAPPGPGPVVARRGDPPPPQLESAAAQLRHAAEARAAIRGEAGPRREAARAAAVEAYRAVRAHFPDDAAACAEAAFRAGELLRASGSVEAALAEFAVARDRGAHTPFRVRAMLESGHVHRRAERHERALAAYEEVFAEEEAARGQRDEAALWIGRVHHEQGRAEDARRTWQRVADGAEDPLDRVRAWDGLASLLVEAGDLEGAAGTLERCRESLAEAAAEETRQGERVRNALSAMRSIDELARAVARRAEAPRGGDEPARRGVERERSGDGPPREGG